MTSYDADDESWPSPIYGLGSEAEDVSFTDGTEEHKEYDLTDENIRQLLEPYFMQLLDSAKHNNEGPILTNGHYKVIQRDNTKPIVIDLFIKIDKNLDQDTLDEYFEYCNKYIGENMQQYYISEFHTLYETKELKVVCKKKESFF
jgi:hypothetical protein